MYKWRNKIIIPIIDTTPKMCQRSNNKDIQIENFAYCKNLFSKPVVVVKQFINQGKQWKRYFERCGEYLHSSFRSWIPDVSKGNINKINTLCVLQFQITNTRSYMVQKVWLEEWGKFNLSSGNCPWSDISVYTGFMTKLVHTNQVAPK